MSTGLTLWGTLPLAQARRDPTCIRMKREFTAHTIAPKRGDKVLQFPPRDVDRMPREEQVAAGWPIAAPCAQPRFLSTVDMPWRVSQQ
eukprot:6870045-Pyramimonas_sp.AAC.1